MMCETNEAPFFHICKRHEEADDEVLSCTCTLLHPFVIAKLAADSKGGGRGGGGSRLGAGSRGGMGSAGAMNKDGGGRGRGSAGGDRSAPRGARRGSTKAEPGNTRASVDGRVR